MERKLTNIGLTKIDNRKSFAYSPMFSSLQRLANGGTAAD